MKLLNKDKEVMTVVSDMDISLANAIRRSVNEIPVMAVDEADIYKNDSALYDEIIAHRLGLIPLKNQKLKADQTVEMKLKAKGVGEKTEVLAKELAGDVVYEDTPITLLEEGQELELVARARMGKGVDHAKFSPGVIFYKHLPIVKISAQGEKQSELAELYPEAFTFDTKLKVKDAVACDVDEEDMKAYPGVSVDFDDNLVFSIESWGQMDTNDMFLEACKALKSNLADVAKAVK